jgi:hypothetical protein
MTTTVWAATQAVSALWTIALLLFLVLIGVWLAYKEAIATRHTAEWIYTIGEDLKTTNRLLNVIAHTLEQEREERLDHDQR